MDGWDFLVSPAKGDKSADACRTIFSRNHYFLFPQMSRMLFLLMCSSDPIRLPRLKASMLSRPLMSEARAPAAPSSEQQDLQQVERVRVSFPETWLWTSVSPGYNNFRTCAVLMHSLLSAISCTGNGACALATSMTASVTLNYSHHDSHRTSSSCRWSWYFIFRF